VLRKKHIHVCVMDECDDGVCVLVTVKEEAYTCVCDG